MSKLILDYEKSSSNSESDGDDRDNELDDKYLMAVLQKRINRMMKSRDPADKRFMNLYHVRNFIEEQKEHEKSNEQSAL